MSTTAVQHPSPRLTLVGAGPGDPELITLKGVKVLQSADVVLYDALVHPDLLKHAPQAQHIYVGKRAGTHYMKQEAIQELIVERAFKFGHVVRLKGGDPFIFGRGQEEITYARSFGIPTAVVPGLSSALAVPASQGIPLTTRGLNESFWVTTGTTSCGVLSEDVQLAAQSTATVVILMGMSRLAEIILLFSAWRSENLPVAVIQQGTWEDEKVAIGTVEDILDKVAEKGISSPAIIVLGDVVGLHPDAVKSIYHSVSNT